MFTQVIGIAILASSLVSGAPDGPKCALQCAGKDSRSCGEYDIPCRCGDEELIRSTFFCIFVACPVDEFQIALQASHAFCSAAGAELKMPMQCAFQCYNKDSPGCDKSDTSCRCRDSEFMESVAQCILASCPADSSAIAIQGAQGFCSAAGAPVNIAPSSSSSIDSAPATPTTSVSITSNPSNTSETSPAQPTKEAAERNANGAIPKNVNVVAGIVAFGLVALAL